MFCNKCGCELKDGENICLACGNDITKVDIPDLMEKLEKNDSLYFEDIVELFKLMIASITGKEKNKKIRNITIIFVYVIGISLFIFLGAFIRPIGYFILNIKNSFDSFWMAFGISPRIGGDILFFGIFIGIIFILKKNSEKWK